MLRRGRLVVLAVAVGAASTFAAPPGQAGTLRTGLARGQLARIVPYVGIPSVGAGVGVAQAEVSGGSARATAGMADFGMMSMILDAVASNSPVPVPALPAPITADDRDHPDVERNPLAPPSSTPAPPAPPAQPEPPEPAALVEAADPGPPAAPAPAWEEAHASKEPESRARVRGPEAGVPGVLMLTGGESRASADGGATSSTVTLARLVLGGNAGVPEVVLSNLVWSARQAIGEPGTASFSIGTVTVAGQVLPVPAGAAPADLLTAVNDALAPAGLRLEVPVTTGDAAGAAVSSLVVQVRNPETVAGLLAEATQPAGPVLDQMLDALLAAAPDASAARLVVNALLATGTTRGGGRLELGGASARIGSTEVADAPAPLPPPSQPPEVTPPLDLPVASAPAPPPAPAPLPVADPAPGFGSGGASGYQSAAPPVPTAPIVPPPAGRRPDPPAAPDGIPLPARPVGTTVAAGASAPLVLGAALLAIAILALGDKLRLRRLAGGGTQ